MKKIIIFLLLTLLFTIPVSALETPETIGLGGFATLDGVDGIYVNPASVNTNNEIFSLDFAVNVGFGNNLFANEFISNDEKANLLDNIKDSGWIVDQKGKGGVNLIIGPLGIFSNMREEGILKTNPDIAEILLTGNETETKYSLDGSSGAGSLYNDSGVNLSFKLLGKNKNDKNIKNEKSSLKNLYLGLNYRILNGVIFDLEAKGNTDIGYDENGEPTFSGDGEFIVKRSDFKEVNGLSDLANGTAFDLGVYGEYGKQTSFGVSFLNIGSLSTDSAIYEKYIFDSSAEDILTLSEERELKEQLKYDLPRKINISGEYDWKEYMSFLFNYSNINYNGLSDNRVSLGTEFTALKFLPLRLGTEYSTLHNDLKIRAGLGLYLGPLKTDIGISDIKGLFNKSKGVEFGISTGISF
jgi:hypothetical protein